LAKMHLKCADAQIYQIVTLSLFTNKLLESIYIAMQRNVAPNHPVYKLLSPHLRSAIHPEIYQNEGLVDTVYSLGGDSKFKLLNKAFRGSSWNKLVFPKDIQQRGVDDPKTLPNYHYRDDGILVWKATEHFVSSILQDHYKTLELIKDDIELQRFIAEAQTHGLKNMCDFPGSFDTFAEIVEFVTTVIWASTVLRSILEKSQFEHFAWIPNYPGCLLKPAPERGETKSEDILEALPTNEISSNQIKMAYDLNTSTTSYQIGHSKEKYFSQEQPQLKLQDYKDELSKVTQEIETKNKERKQPYTWLSPDIF